MCQGLQVQCASVSFSTTNIFTANKLTHPQTTTLLPWSATMDETTPLLPDAATAPIPRDDQLHRVPSKDFVDFDPNGDDENPLDWPKSYKWVIVALLSAMSFTV